MKRKNVKVRLVLLTTANTRMFYCALALQDNDAVDPSLNAQQLSEAALLPLTAQHPPGTQAMGIIAADKRRPERRTVATQESVFVKCNIPGK